MRTENKAIDYIRKGYTLINGQKIRLGSNIDLEESSFIYDFIKNDKSISPISSL